MKREEGAARGADRGGARRVLSGDRRAAASGQGERRRAARCVGAPDERGSPGEGAERRKAPARRGVVARRARFPVARIERRRRGGGPCRRGERWRRASARRAAEVARALRARGLGAVGRRRRVDRRRRVAQFGGSSARWLDCLRLRRAAAGSGRRTPILPLHHGLGIGRSARADHALALIVAASPNARTAAPACAQREACAVALASGSSRLSAGPPEPPPRTRPASGASAVPRGRLVEIAGRRTFAPGAERSGPDAVGAAGWPRGSPSSCDSTAASRARAAGRRARGLLAAPSALPRAGEPRRRKSADRAACRESRKHGARLAASRALVSTLGERRRAPRGHTTRAALASARTDCGADRAGRRVSTPAVFRSSRYWRPADPAASRARRRQPRRRSWRRRTSTRALA